MLGRIEYLMLDAIPRLSEDLQLILQKVRIVAPHHARHVLDDERLGVYQVKSASKFFVQRVDAARWLPNTTLAETLTGVTANKELGARDGVQNTGQARMA